jgi:exodeoxyribonuclease VII small subunit
MSKKPPEDISGLPFDEALERLESVVAKLETAEPGLDESLQLFREGAELVRRCRVLLAEAVQEVSALSDEGDLEAFSGLEADDEEFDEAEEE